jgi:hypothetical protein
LQSEVLQPDCCATGKSPPDHNFPALAGNFNRYFSIQLGPSALPIFFGHQPSAVSEKRTTPIVIPTRINKMAMV